MVNSSQAGAVKAGISKFSLLFVAAVLALVSTLAIVSGVSASSHAHTFEFTQQEIDDNWEADRMFPTDGATSVSEFGRDDVARLGVDSTQTAAGTFQRTEGIKTVGDNNFGDAVEVDLYVDADWENKAVRAGAWVVGDDGSTTARDNLFGIIEFVNLEPSTTGDSVQGDHEGWRYWDSNTGWTNLSTDFEYGEWVTLTIELDTSVQQYNYYVNGDLVASASGGENFIREVFLNSYNYGLDTFPNLSNSSYAAHWHGGVAQPTSKDECKKGGHADFGFRNQGLCIQFVNTGKDSR